MHSATIVSPHKFNHEDHLTISTLIEGSVSFIDLKKSVSFFAKFTTFLVDLFLFFSFGVTDGSFPRLQRYFHSGSDLNGAVHRFVKPPDAFMPT